MQLFYTTDIKDGIAYLPETEARHCVQVLRHREGDVVRLIDGTGGYYEAEIVETAKKACVLRILKEEQAYKQQDYKLQLAIAPPKNTDRFEWLLEKATEIGVDTFSPIICHRSDRKKLRAERLEKVILSAAKQSIQAYLPVLDALQSFNKFLRADEKSTAGQKFIAHCASGDLPLLQQKYQPGQNVSILIGPEGDFTAQEIENAEQAGYQSISLGRHRLRTETAGLMACHTVHILNSIHRPKG